MEGEIMLTVEEIRQGEKVGGWYILPNGNGVTLGHGVKLGDWVKLGDRVTLGNGVSSAELNLQFRAMYAGKCRFWKWVTPERMSPNFDGGTPVQYPTGAIVEAPDAVISDQQCAHGLHVLRVGYRPEWVGLCEPAHGLICLEVEVDAEDICFAGLPTMDTKLRVRKLKVLS